MSRDVQRQIIEAIPDEYTKQSQLAYFYQGKEPDNEIAALKAAEKSVENSLGPDAPDKLISVIDRIFRVRGERMRDPKTEEAERDGYWAVAKD